MTKVSQSPKLRTPIKLSSNKTPNRAIQTLTTTTQGRAITSANETIEIKIGAEAGEPPPRRRPKRQRVKTAEEGVLETKFNTSKKREAITSLRVHKLLRR